MYAQSTKKIKYIMVHHKSYRNLKQSKPHLHNLFEEIVY